MFGLDFLDGTLNGPTILLLIWTLVWKGWALWRASQRGQRNWFIIILIVNTLGILEIIYIFFVTKKQKKENPPAKAEEAPKEISITDFSKLDLRVGTILEAEELADSKKLIKLSVNLGEEKRQILAGLKEFYKPDELIGKQVVIVANLAAKELMGNLSQGMVLAADLKGKPVLLQVEKDVPVGVKVR